MSGNVVKALITADATTKDSNDITVHWYCMQDKAEAFIVIFKIGKEKKVSWPGERNEIDSCLQLR